MAQKTIIGDLEITGTLTNNGSAVGGGGGLYIHYISNNFKLISASPTAIGEIYEWSPMEGVVLPKFRFTSDAQYVLKWNDSTNAIEMTFSAAVEDEVLDSSTYTIVELA